MNAEIKPPLPSPLNIHQRIAQVMQQVDYIQKEKKQGMNYTIVTHDAVTAKLRPQILAAGMVYYPIKVVTGQDGNRTSCQMTVRFVNVDMPEDFIQVEAFGYGVDSQDKGPGKAQSYAMKYALLKTFGLETGDEPDEVQDSRADHVPGYIEELRELDMGIQDASTKDELDALIKKHGTAIDQATKTHGALVAQVRQRYAAKAKTIKEAMAEPADA